MRVAAGVMSWGRQLDPGSFALVMATGIVSIGLEQLGFWLAALMLFGFNLLAYTSLVAMSLLRWLHFRQQMLADFLQPSRGVSFLTFVAATCVLGNQSLMVVNCPALAAFFLIVGLISWCFLLYFFLLTAIASPNKMDGKPAIHAGWLIIVVATQAVAISAAEFVPRVSSGAEWLSLLALCLFLVGLFWYVVLIVPLTQRMVFVRFRPQDLTPPYWINMGALAITTLAGCVMVRYIASTGLYAPIKGFIEGLTVLSWAFASWWIPLLLLLGAWRYLYCRLPFRYHVSNWNIVFPLGMYTVCTLELSRMLGLDFLRQLPEITIYISFVAWLLVLVGALRKARRLVC